VSIGFKDERVLTGLVGLAVVLREQVDQQLADVVRKTGLKRDFPGPFIKIVHEQYELLRQS
jgi:hypothetical protein